MKTLIVSNVQGNWPALQAVLAAEPDAGRMLCLGDLIGDGPQPGKCVAWAMQLAPPSRVVCAPIPSAADAGKRGNENADTSPDFLRRLPAEMRRFLAGLTPFQQFDWDGAVCFACQRMARRPLRPADLARLEARHWDATELTRMDTDLILTGVPGKLYVLVGHPDFLFLADGGEAMQTTLNGTVIVNPGSLGMSAGDGAGAPYAVWQDGAVALRRAGCDREESVHADAAPIFAEASRRPGMEDFFAAEHAVETGAVDAVAEATLAR
jgi:protein phosphatase